MITFPLYVDEHGDISTYDDLHDAECSLEVVDVLNKEFVVYDANAHLLTLEIVSRFWGPDKVRIREPDKPIRQEKEFRRVLEQYLAECEQVEIQSLSRMTVDELAQSVRRWSD